MRGDQSLKEPGDRPPGSVPHGWARTVAAAEPQVGFDKTGQAPRAQGQAGRGAAGMGVGPAPGAVALSRSRCPHTCWVDTRVLPPPAPVPVPLGRLSLGRAGRHATRCIRSGFLCHLLTRKGGTSNTQGDLHSRKAFGLIDGETLHVTADRGAGWGRSRNSAVGCRL